MNLWEYRWRGGWLGWVVSRSKGWDGIMAGIGSPRHGTTLLKAILDRSRGLFKSYGRCQSLQE